MPQTNLGSEIVIIRMPNKNLPFRALGRDTHLCTGDDGLIRSAQIKQGDESLQVHSLKHLHPLVLSFKCPLNILVIAVKRSG